MFDLLVFAGENLWPYAGNTRLVRQSRRFNHRLPDIADPKLCSERMLWRKLVDHDPRFVICCDKLATEDYVQRICSESPSSRAPVMSGRGARRHPRAAGRRGAATTPLPPEIEIREPYLRAVCFAEKLDEGVDQVRVDFLWNGSVLFGEITNPAAGLQDPVDALMLGGWDLARAHFLNAPHRGWKRIHAGALRRSLSRRATRRARPPVGRGH